MVEIQSAAAEIRRGKKKKETKNKDRNHRAKILHRAAIKRAVLLQRKQTCKASYYFSVSNQLE